MPSSLIQRLIGACVLVGIIALLWSVVFEDFEPEKLDRQSQIPDTPAFEKFKVEGGSILVKKQAESAQASKSTEVVKVEQKLQKSTEVASNQSKKSVEPKAVAQPKSTVQSKSAVQAKPTKPKSVVQSKPKTQVKPNLPPVASAPKFDDKGVPVTWVVQVASFSSQDNAKKLLKRLVNKKYKAYMRTNSQGEKTIYRLKIGPFIDLAKAKQVNREIKRDFKLDGLVARYKVH